MKISMPIYKPELTEQEERQAIVYIEGVGYCKTDDTLAAIAGFPVNVTLLDFVLSGA